MVRVPTARRPAGRRNVAPVSPPSNGAVLINPILRHMDLSTKIRSLRTKESTKKQYLSKATIFKKWVDLNHPYLMEPVTDEDVSALSISDRDNLFQDRYLQLFRKMYPDQSEDHHDRRRIGDLTYMTVYDLMSSSMNN